MSFATITQLKTALNRGARANLFEIDIPFPTLIGATNLPTDANARVKVLCKSAAVHKFCG